MYFSDGCAGQYKCCENFLHICNHEKLYGLKAEWNFFATSHGKSPCDAIGGTMKRDISKESLRRPLENQILTVIDMQKYCKENIKKINVFLVLKEDIVSYREKITNETQTLPGTRTYYQFLPLSEKNVACELINFDETFETISNLLAKKNYNWEKKHTFPLFLMIHGI